MDPAKLKQLQNRLVKPQSSKGPVPLPSFPGVQEFYKSFIFYAYDPMFYKHLENCFIHEILELNDAQFVADEIENTGMTDSAQYCSQIKCIIPFYYKKY